MPPISSPIVDGNPVIGTWNRAFDKVDLQEIRRPYGYPIPRWLMDYRIKEWQSFSVSNHFYLMEALFCNVRLFKMAQVILYDIKKEEKFIFRKVKPGTGWRLPPSLANSSVDSHSSRFFFRIHSWLDADTIKLDINIEATSKRPSLTAHLAYNINHDTTPIAVSLDMSKRQIMYAYKVLAPLQGDIVFAGKHMNLKAEACSGLFTDYKGFFPYRMQTTYCSAAGFDDENRRFGFHIAENQTRETNKNNENALWLNGNLTPLPPVLITMPSGQESDWVIQDVEGMVDLTFTPKEQIKSSSNLIVTRADLNAPIGHYNGVLVSGGGEKIQIKNLLGIGEKLYLRV
ncbi:MAG: DUF2804 domain-containing protein [Treponema sp.]|nr:DUF2804 domain-containing protein [Treponema sp.]